LEREIAAADEAIRGARPMLPAVNGEPELEFSEH